MKNWAAVRVRYTRDEPAVQLGGLASNLSRIAWFAQRRRRDEALPVFRESKYFTEWAATACSMEQQGLLAELQFQLASWERVWGKSVDPSAIAEDAQHWSAQLLESASRS